MFGYIGAFVKDREQLIEDDDDPTEDEDNKISDGNFLLRKKEICKMTDEKKKILSEQSDLCMILFNIGYIPDSVLKQVKFGTKGWSRDFKNLMSFYKAGWQVQTKKKWIYTKHAKYIEDKNEVEQHYLAFKEQQEKVDKHLIIFAEQYKLLKKEMGNQKLS